MLHVPTVSNDIAQRIAKQAAPVTLATAQVPHSTAPATWGGKMRSQGRNTMPRAPCARVIFLLDTTTDDVTTTVVVLVTTHLLNNWFCTA